MSNKIMPPFPNSISKLANSNNNMMIIVEICSKIRLIAYIEYNKNKRITGIKIL